MRAWSLAAPVAVVASTVACGGANDGDMGSDAPTGGSDSTEGPTPEDQFYQQVATVLCEAIAHCCQAAGYAPGTCAPQSDTRRDGTYTGDLAGGLLGEKFVASAAGPCLETIQQKLAAAPGLCSDEGGPDISALVAMCPGLYAGGTYEATPLGGACAPYGSRSWLNDYECAPSADGTARCETWTTMTGDGTTLWSGCIDAVSVGTAGDVCGVSSNGDLPVPPTSLRVAASCGPGLYCAPSSRCAPLATAGARCTREGSCAGGLRCDPASLTCVALPGAGQPCWDGSCASGLACAANATCEPPPSVVGLGDACDGVTTICTSSAYCNATAGTCVALRAGGAACGGGVECASAQCVQGTCTSPPAPAPRVPRACGTMS
jgi:hypothetical protein